MTERTDEFGNNEYDVVFEMMLAALKAQVAEQSTINDQIDAEIMARNAIKKAEALKND